MYVNSLKLVNYRNYESLLIEFNKNINLILGKNGQGKTNIVESLTLMSIGKSFRTNRDKELIRFDSENLYTACSFTRNKIDKKIEIVITKDKKGIKVNGVSIKSIQELLGNLNVVVFSPEDLKLVKDGPKERRTFIDKEISQIMPRYYNLLTSYNKVINQRNRLLKSQKVDNNLLDVYDQGLANFGGEIYSIRRKFIDKLSDISNKLHKDLTSDKENLTIKYKNQLGIDQKSTLEDIRKKMLEKLEESRQQDLLNRNTKVGPHKDDLAIFINDVDVRLYGSQGQQRTVSISLKLSEIELIKRELGDYPILILDDVFSELDQNRQKMLVEKLGDIQMFVTSADPLHKNILSQSNYSVFYIEEGQLVKIENGGN
ncbi:DNA replication/repair protein RecF [Peptostreptococcus russellii]|uniref:DNA replication/repair protein RecF n=1 Tax=Peptostreptococcus russellii TaxID=215200 RepID=UPI003F5816BA